MEDDRKFDYWVSTLQNGYIGALVDIVGRAGGAKKLYYMKEDGLKYELGLSDRLVKLIENNRKIYTVSYIEECYEKLSEDEIQFVCYKDESYPEKLLNISDRPYGLFVRGQIPSGAEKTVAIVGARECSEYGRLMAEYFGDRLARKGVTIVSGMAWGIDGIAQMSAVGAGGRSIAVLGCGVDICYPKNNINLYRKLTQAPNAVISEYCPNTKPISRLFPPRNRIISGLCDILLVVEARAKSGTLITTDMAIEQGKTVMIVPGRITDPLSAGCINLMSEGALPALNVDSVMSVLEGEINGSARGMKYSKNGSVSREGQKGDNDRRVVSSNYQENYTQMSLLDLSDVERRIFNQLDFEPKTAQNISEALSVPVSDILISLTMMEVKGYVREMGVCSFVRCKCNPL